MKLALGALMVSLLTLVGCSSSPDENAVTEPVATEVAPVQNDAATQAKAVVDDIDSKPAAAEPVAVEKPASGDTKYVTTSALNVRSGPGMSFGIVRVAKFKEKLEATETSGSWVKIGDGQYVAKSYVSSTEPTEPNDPAPKAAPAETSAPAEAAPAGDATQPATGGDE